MKEKIKNMSIDRALKVLKSGVDCTIKIKQGTIFQKGGERYFIRNDGTIVYKTEDGLKEAI